jgi:hypothetical protein
VEIGVLAVRDDELDVGDDEVALSDVAEGGTAREGQGKSRGWAREQLPLKGAITIHVDGRNRTSDSWEQLDIAGYRGFKERLSIESRGLPSLTCHSTRFDVTIRWHLRVLL